MSAEDHPKFQSWRGALDKLVQAETRYYRALMEDRPHEEIEVAARALDEARARYLKVTGEIG